MRELDEDEVEASGCDGSRNRDVESLTFGFEAPRMYDPAP